MMASASLVTFWACVNYFIATGIITEKSSFNRIAHGNLSQAQTEPCGQQLNSVRRPAWAAHWWIIIERKLPPSIGCLACEYQLCTLLWSCRTNRDHSTRHSDLKTLSIKCSINPHATPSYHTFPLNFYLKIQKNATLSHVHYSYRDDANMYTHTDIFPNCSLSFMHIILF